MIDFRYDDADGDDDDDSWRRYGDGSDCDDVYDDLASCDDAFDDDCLMTSSCDVYYLMTSHDREILAAVEASWSKKNDVIQPINRWMVIGGYLLMSW